MRFCTAIAKPEADQELTELERIYCMRGLASCVQNGVLALLRDVDTNDLVFRVRGVRRDTGERPPPYWLLDLETQTCTSLRRPKCARLIGR
jgi:hypothetical protein